MEALTKKWVFGFVLVAVSLPRLTYVWDRCGRPQPQDQREGVVLRETLPPSSVACHYGSSGEKVCRFCNICYDPHFQEFQFVLTEESVIAGIQNPASWMDIDMSTVLGHNAFKMKVSLISPENELRRKFVRVQRAPTFVVHRFKPDNIMHVLHDDLIPLHYTIESMFGKAAVQSRDFSLAFSDSFPPTKFDEWYSHFSGTPFIRLTGGNETVCFKEAYVGLYRDTLWFDYGFKQPHGPYRNINFNLRGVRSFVNFSLDAWKLKSNSHLLLHHNRVVLLVRSQTRKILNIDELKEKIKVSHREIYPENILEIVEIDLALHVTSFILSQIRQANLIIGMHGAGMILSIFLPPSSGVVELFPFGINPENVSFLKALFRQQQSYPLYYASWRNDDRKNSVPSEQNDPLMGQISHLPVPLQNLIMGLSEVPAVKCCHDAAYLYYIFHDTIVNDKVFHSVRKAFAETQTSKVVNESGLLYHIYPALPRFLSCEIFNNVVSIEWGDLSNPHENGEIWFQITVLNGEQMIVKNVTSGSTKFLSMKFNDTAPTVVMWFQSFNIKNVGGHIKYINCIKIVN